MTSSGPAPPGPPSGRHSVELRHLRAFAEVAGELSFTRAAERLDMSQPTLTRTISQLERLLGVALLTRTSHRVDLTTAGARYVDQVRRILALVDESFDTAVTETTTLKLGLSRCTSADYAAAIAAEFERGHPGVVVDLERVDRLRQRLSDGSIHVALFHRPRKAHWATAETLALTAEPRVAAMSRDHRLTKYPSLRLDDLQGEVLVTFASAPADYPAPYLRPADPLPQVERVADADQWMMVIACGRAIGLTEESAVRPYQHAGIVTRPIVDISPIPLFVGWAKGQAHPLVRPFIDTARAYFARVSR